MRGCLLRNPTWLIQSKHINIKKPIVRDRKPKPTVLPKEHSFVELTDHAPLLVPTLVFCGGDNSDGGYHQVRKDVFHFKLESFVGFLMVMVIIKEENFCGANSSFFCLFNFLLKDDFEAYNCINVT